MVACHRLQVGFVSPMCAALYACVSMHDPYTLAIQIDAARVPLNGTGRWQTPLRRLPRTPQTSVRSGRATSRLPRSANAM